MVPVALADRHGMDRPTVLFVGWFGPRGLASVVFALLAVEELGDASSMGEAIAVVALTVLLSVVLGVSAGPFGSRCVRAEGTSRSRRRPGPEGPASRAPTPHGPGAAPGIPTTTQGWGALGRAGSYRGDLTSPWTQGPRSGRVSSRRPGPSSRLP